MRRKTKIICTIGPAVNSYEMLKKLAIAGMDVARLNFSHSHRDEQGVVIERIKRVREELGLPIAILLDTKGPEIRIGRLRNEECYLKPGSFWTLTKEQIIGDENRVTLHPEIVVDKLAIGDTVLFDDGFISSTVVEKSGTEVMVQIENGGLIRSRKGVNIPTANFELPMLSSEDIADIRYGCRQDVDIVAASFVCSAEHILAIKNLLQEEGKPDTIVIAKIESRRGVENFDSIVQLSDGIMIARGDLGVEVPLSQVPKLQKMMIRKCYLAGKPSVTATQMLESMITNPRPTRAEASDVANAIYDSTSAVMLSGETAIGKFPIEAVLVMKSIIKETERDFNYRAFFDEHSKFHFHDVPSSVTLASVKTGYNSGAAAIFAFTSGGLTARLVSRLRPRMPIIAITPNLKAYYQLAFSWGVIPEFSPGDKSFGEAFDHASKMAVQKGYVKDGDLVVVTAGSPFGVSGTTNMLIVESIGDVLIRGHKGLGKRVHGRIFILLLPEKKKAYEARDQILVIAKYDESYRPFVQEAKGIVLQNHVDDSASEKLLAEHCKDLKKTAILRADFTSQALKEGQLVTLDPENALVYKGVSLGTPE